MLEDGLTVEEVDALTGPLIGRPRSATFRTFDVVGLDTYMHVARNLYETLPDDPERERFKVPDILEQLAARGRLGEKTGEGFYRRVRAKGGSTIEALDTRTLEYVPLRTPTVVPAPRAAKQADVGKRIRALALGGGRAGDFLWKITSATISYAAGRIPEIADDVVSVDNAMKWGFGHQLGPFETWDALGVGAAAERLRAEGRAVPPVVESLLASGAKSFYRRRSGRSYHFAPETRAYVRTPEPEGVISLRALHERKQVVRGNASASLLDLGDGVACLEFHSKMNTIDADVLEMLEAALEETARGFSGLVIANEGENFSVGANLVEVLTAARAGRWDDIDRAVRRLQQATLRLRRFEKPVVAAPHQRAIGGGCEIVLHADAVHAAAELYMGFVELGVGLVPAGGGCKEMVVRAADGAGTDSDTELFPRVRRAFELIATARVSGSATEARELGLLRDHDHISLNADQRILQAKQDVLAVAREGYTPPPARTEVPVLGTPGYASLRMGLHQMLRAGYITEYDNVVASRLAFVLTGGAYPGARRIPEEALLDLEREAFLGLAGEAKTQERMEYMLREGKPLRN
jgi:3-hydroxyacyl-CoA dehydrogenase